MFENDEKKRSKPSTKMFDCGWFWLQFNRTCNWHRDLKFTEHVLHILKYNVNNLQICATITSASAIIWKWWKTQKWRWCRIFTCIKIRLQTEITLIKFDKRRLGYQSWTSTIQKLNATISLTPGTCWMWRKKSEKWTWKSLSGWKYENMENMKISSWESTWKWHSRGKLYRNHISRHESGVVTLMDCVHGQPTSLPSSFSRDQWFISREFINVTYFTGCF